MDSVRKAVSFLFLSTLLILSAGAAEAADRNDLVVMLGYRAADAPYNAEVGAGILVHQDEDTALVVTVHHNLPRREAGRDETVYVEFFSVGGKDFPARILEVDEDLDLAVLEVSAVPVAPELFESARHVLVPQGADVVLEHGSFAVGNPNRRPWFQNYAPEPILGTVRKEGREEIRFESSVADVGISGGALFSEHGALLGMVKTIRGGQGGASALGIGTIARRLEDWGLPFSLEESREVFASASRKILTDLGLASAAGLRQALAEEPADFGLLHLFWLADLEPLELEAALTGPVEGSRKAFAAQVFERLGQSACRLPSGGGSRLTAAQAKLVQAGLGRAEAGGETCADHLRRWLRGVIQAGLDPDLVVASEYYPREALLGLAMRARNGPAALELLVGGASPHAYQDLSGTEYPSTRLLSPLKYVVEDFVGDWQDALREAFTAAGVVVSRSIQDNYYAGEATLGMRQTPSLAKSETDPICERAGERYSFDWCGYLHGLETALRYYTGTQGCDSSGYCFAALTHSLFVGEDRALLLAERQDSRETTPVVVEVPREPGPWYAWEYGRSYGCIARDDGFEPSNCWRKYRAWPASYRSTEEKAEAERRRAASTPSVLDHVDVEGISLATPLPEALAALTAAGYTTRTVAGPGDHRNLATTRDYTFKQGEETRTLKVIAVNDTLRALSFRTYGESQAAKGLEVPDEGDGDFLFYESKVWPETKEVLAVEASGVGRTFLRYRQSTSRFVSVELDLLRRAEKESAPEHAFYDRWLHDWLGPVELASDAQRPCIDRYAHLRGLEGNGCLTPQERADSYLEEVVSGSNVRQLASGLSYEVLVEGQGPSPRPDSSVVATVVFKYLDGARKDDRFNNWRIVVQDSQWPDLEEALLSMKEGDKWRLYVPPGVGSNGTSYLQLTEIHLRRVGGD